METTKLNNGLTVLAKKHSSGNVYAVTYSNRTQAQNKANELSGRGFPCHVWQGPRPFYVVIEEAFEDGPLPELTCDETS